MNDLPLIEELGSGHVSAYWQYLNMFVGSQSLAELLRYEALTAILGPMPGALGYFLRGKCYRWILNAIGNGSVVGRGCQSNGDNKITADDRTVIGTPHPDFTGSLDLGYRYGNFDLSGTIFGSFGNEIFDAQKEFYVFRQFSTNVRADLLENSWTPTNTNSKYPIIDIDDSYSHALSDFYVEDGSYVRLRNVQVGYNVPQRFARFLNATRVYVQAENLFTITGYEGLDPSLPAADVNGAAGDIRDQHRGVDRGIYPSSKTFSIGITTSF